MTACGRWSVKVLRVSLAQTLPRLLAGLALVAIAPGRSWSADIDSPDSVSKYAKACYKELDISAGLFEKANGNRAFLQCKSDGTGGTPTAVKLSTTWTRKGDGTGPDDDAANTVRADCTPSCDLVAWAGTHAADAATVPWPGSAALPRPAFPPACDRPAWLDNNNNQCYGNTYVQRIEIKKDDKLKVNAVLLCRHKTQFGDDGDTTFDDVALIMHNPGNGRTCWFQAPTGTRNLDGTKVLYPHKDTKVAVDNKHDFWFTPQRTATVKCAGCHDNGPWMNSYWMRQANVVPADDEMYAIPGDQFKNAGWKLKFVSDVNVAPGMDSTGRQQAACTSCHRISVREVSVTPLVGIGVAPLGEGTCRRWLHWTTRGGPAHDNFPPSISKYGKTWEKAGWMPERVAGRLVPDTEAQWDLSYKAHVEKVLVCCETPAAGGCDIETACNDFGGGGGGCIPPTRTIEICEAKLAAATDKLLTSIVKCHRLLAQEQLADDEACETDALTAFDTRVARLTGCPPCVTANLTTIKTQAQSLLDANAHLIYCAGTDPLGGDDTGYVPPPLNAACEHATSTATAKLVARVIKCRRLRARGKLTDAEQATCEANAATEFDVKIASQSGCPSCLDAALIKSTFQGIVDTQTELAFCASSPSGAFLDEPY